MWLKATNNRMDQRRNFSKDRLSDVFHRETTNHPAFSKKDGSTTTSSTLVVRITVTIKGLSSKSCATSRRRPAKKRVAMPGKTTQNTVNVWPPKHRSIVIDIASRAWNKVARRALSHLEASSWARQGLGVPNLQRNHILWSQDVNVPPFHGHPLHLSHIGQEEPDVDVAEGGVQKRHHPKSARPPNWQVCDKTVCGSVENENLCDIWFLICAFCSHNESIKNIQDKIIKTFKAILVLTSSGQHLQSYPLLRVLKVHQKRCRTFIASVHSVLRTTLFLCTKKRMNMIPSPRKAVTSQKVHKETLEEHMLQCPIKKKGMWDILSSLKNSNPSDHLQSRFISIPSKETWGICAFWIWSTTLTEPKTQNPQWQIAQLVRINPRTTGMSDWLHHLAQRHRVNVFLISQ